MDLGTFLISFLKIMFFNMSSFFSEKYMPSKDCSVFVQVNVY